MPRTLIADDQPDVLEALRLLLKPEGYQIETVSSPRAVVESLARQKFDLLLMDLNYARDTTSGQEGLELLRRVQELDGALPVVVMTAWGNIQLAVEAMRRGARDFVEKPWDNARLLAVLREQIAARSGGRDREEEAAAVQRELLPREVPRIEGFEIALSWQPLENVGGDYVDFLDLGGGRLGLGVADAIGKGVGAALLMANLQAAVRALATDNPAPEELAGRVNRQVAGSTGVGKYITFFYGVLNPACRRLAYTNAGHNAPVLVRAGGECLRLDEGGMVLGVMPGWHYRRGEAELNPGDRLVLFTDGITEVENAAGEPFGEEPLACIVQANRSLGAAALAECLLSEVKRFSGARFQDDATLVVLAAH